MAIIKCGELFDLQHNLNEGHSSNLVNKNILSQLKILFFLCLLVYIEYAISTAFHISSLV